MGYTNKTSHYELPQYVANDKPSWLGDFNAAMLKIDTVMADNDATAEAANSAATGAQTQVAALSSQLSTIQGQVNTAIDTANTADGKATTAQSVANQAGTTAGEAKTLAETAKQTADNALPIGGGTMTGPLVLNGAPAQDNQAATKAYVDEHSGKITSSELDADLITLNENYFSVNAQLPTILIYNNGLIEFAWTITAGTISAGTTVYAELATISGNPFNIPQQTKYAIGRGNLTDDWKRCIMYVVFDGTNTVLYEQGVTPKALSAKQLMVNSTTLMRVLS